MPIITYSTGSNPLVLPSLRLYLSATRMAQQVDNTNVSTFADFSSNGYDATQATTGLQPKFKINQFGLNAGINFDGIDDLMNLTGGALDIMRNVSDYTIQVVCKRNVLGLIDSRVIVIANGINTGSRLSIFFNSTSIQIATNHTDNTGLVGNYQIISNDLNPHMVQLAVSNGVMNIYFDGTLHGNFNLSAVSTPNTASGVIAIGGNPINNSFYLNGSIQGLTINHSYLDTVAITRQYQGYLQRGWL